MTSNNADKLGVTTETVYVGESDVSTRNCILSLNLLAWLPWRPVIQIGVVEDLIPLSSIYHIVKCDSTMKTLHTLTCQ